MAVRILQYSDLENAYDRPDRIARVAGVLESLRGTETLLLGTGDDLAPGMLSMLTQGRHALRFFERLEPDLETFGNHDFDYGPEALCDIVATSPQEWIATNVYRHPPAEGSAAESSSSRFGADAGVSRTALRAVDGTRIGFVGLLDPVTPGDTPTATDLVVTDPVEEARSAATSLRKRGAEHVLGLAHLGDVDSLASKTDLDAILAGHRHAPRIDHVDGTVVARPGSNGRKVIELSLDGEQWTATCYDVSEGPRLESVETAFAELRSEAGLDAAVATVDRPVRRTDEIVYGGPCRIGTTIAEAYRWWTDADVGLQNSGGIRSGPPLEGTVQERDLLSVIPFDERVAVFELTREELRSVLDERDGATIDGAPDDRYMGHVSGRETLEEVPADREEEGPVTLATSEYLCHAESEFPTVTGREPASVTDWRQYEVLLEYVEAEGIPEDVSAGPRLRQPQND